MSISVEKVLRLDLGKYLLKMEELQMILTEGIRERLDKLLRALPALFFSDSLI